eukprot:CAMPEP_0201574382 /NCGR_PEP_ID=MMETSP0190_2-20130828/18822_1 /ASSEMBLY_ACC=CAM_ASM_000263 /TAXON_ID=37353 /ORGANISM="Rosalina sp." /LENGTH=359 /DNA_ID=CAMNT_0048002547 /DNA_START=26 /DNA_END=1105 /DNA_ORIENTATION=-
MAENPTDHNAHAKSLAFLNEQGKVSGYEMPSQEHVSKNPSDLQEIAEAQVVTTNKDNYAEQPETAPDLQSGPAKKYIDNPDQNQNQNQDQSQSQTQSQTQSEEQQPQAVPLSNFAHAALHNKTETTLVNDNNDVLATGASGASGASTGANGTGSLDAFAPSTDDKDKQNYESFFADDSNANNTNANNEQTTTTTNNNVEDDLFAGMGGQQQDNYDAKNMDDGVGVDIGGSGGSGGGGGDEEEKQEDKQTFLSVWQEQHREQLAKKAKEERETQEKMIQTAKEELEGFNEKRRAKVESQRKDAQSRESDLKDDYNAVFKNGTIWQQVAKLVDLTSNNKKTERMRDLLIVLKNQDEQKSDQ